MNTDKLTRQVIAKMLKENTGTHFLDSGSAYGRHWQHNQVREFENENPVSLTFKYKSIDYTLNIYHFLCNALEYNKGLTNSFYTFEKKQSEYDDYSEIIDNWIKYKGYTSILSEYTYNQENMLSQDFIFNLISIEDNRNYDLYDTTHCILQIHGGCDARGGFTAPKVFDVDIDSLLNYASGYISCQNGHSWYTDDGYHWYSDQDNTKLNEYDFLEYDEWIESEEYQELSSKQIIIPDEQIAMFSDYNPKVINPVKLPLGMILILEDGNALCPLCSAELMA